MIVHINIHMMFQNPPTALTSFLTPFMVRWVPTSESRVPRAEHVRFLSLALWWWFHESRSPPLGTCTGLGLYSLHALPCFPRLLYPDTCDQREKRRYNIKYICTYVCTCVRMHARS